MSLRQIARHWHVSTNTIVKLERAGKLKGIRISNRVYYDSDKVTELLGAPKLPITICYRNHFAA